MRVCTRPVGGLLVKLTGCRSAAEPHARYIAGVYRLSSTTATTSRKDGCVFGRTHRLAVVNVNGVPSCGTHEDGKPVTDTSNCASCVPSDSRRARGRTAGCGGDRRRASPVQETTTMPVPPRERSSNPLAGCLTAASEPGQSDRTCDFGPRLRPSSAWETPDLKQRRWRPCRGNR